MDQVFATTAYAQEVPRTVEEALEYPKWCQAMKLEVDALETNEPWKKCVLPHEKRRLDVDGCSQ